MFSIRHQSHYLLKQRNLLSSVLRFSHGPKYSFHEEEQEGLDDENMVRKVQKYHPPVKTGKTGIDIVRII